MRVDIIQKGRVLRSINHEGQTYVQAPKKGKYIIRLHNDSWKRQLAVVSVDGVNVLDGTDAGHDGPGYVLNPWETVDIPGFLRDNSKVAAFRFKEQGQSYAAQTGRGTQNVGVIGVAVFDEKVQFKVPTPPIVIREEHHHHHYDRWPWVQPHITWGTGTAPVTYTVGNVAPQEDAPIGIYCSTVAPSGGEQSSSGVLRSAGPQAEVNGLMDVGTAYGEEVTFHTTDCDFERATQSPVQVFVLRYATYQRLKSWGVPVDEAPSARPQAPNPFPASQPSVPAPPGWQP